ncbi:cell surface protein SprA [Paraflavisolibacter sp. H34]|uniref:T9SS outer membrane translocon Sov/SprA n=1 Tax=Huijunlia imazamoxiresistens TaxID=3127457 RepID=UPI003018B654
MLIAVLLPCAFLLQAAAQDSASAAGTGRRPGSSDTIPFPLQDRRGDYYTYPNRNKFDFADTAFIKRSVEYDPKTKQYYIIEKLGNQYYRTPMTFSMQEFLDMQGRKDENEYFRKRANLLIDLNRRNYKPNFGFSKDWVNRITGNGKVDIKPSGYVDIAAGYQGQNIKNPTLPERARRTGGFDFPMNVQLQVDANIGDKIKLPINYNTLANFDFENQLKLDYRGKDDELLKVFQAGNVNFSSKSTLIPGAQSLFGVKTQLQFGKLFVTGILANQRSQRQTLGLQGGSATQTFNLRADEYEENRHFLMAQYFRNHYNRSMSTLPVVTNNIQILRVEVWVTNRTGATTETRDVVGLMDLAESAPYNPRWVGSPDSLPRNDANELYRMLVNRPEARNSTQVQSVLTTMGLQPVQEFEKTFARKLQPTDFYFNPQVGFLSLNQPLQPDEVLGIAYQYTYNGRVFQVGEFSQDVPPDSSGNAQKVLFLKLMKATSQRPNLPLWDLMMKNVYGVGYGQLERQDFQLNIMYEEPSLGEKRYLPEESLRQEHRGEPILSQVRLDRLNNQNDPQPDGVFDFVEGYTVISSQSRIIFPVLEPFGRDLEYVYASPAEAAKYLYYPLYDTIKAIAQTFANLNRFKLVGRSKSASNTDYQLGFNIPQGSVTVTAGGQVLVENVDYEINYDLGTLKIINSAIINAGLPVQVQYENNASFGLQQRNYMGMRLDYLMNKRLTLGGTIVRLGERPFFTKQSYGDDPIRNTMYGLDFDYHNDNIPRLTNWLNRLPFYATTAPSSITAYGEFAALKPGHAPQIGKGGAGVIYIDDFEGTRSSVDLRFPLTSWTLASVPQKATDANGQVLFPEAELNDDPASGYNRAKLAWYNIEPVLQERGSGGSNNPLRGNLAELSKPETRQVLQQEIFPQRTSDLGQALLTTFDLAYYPKEKGPYNFLADPTRINGNGQLLQPRKTWGGIMRNIDQTDFETSNIEFIEFWMQDPFINKPGSAGGELYFNIGNLSEDVLKDGKRQYENGLPTPTQSTLLDETAFGKVPRNPLQVTNAFSNDPADRPYQDVGFDGLPDTAEVRKFQPYLNQLQSNFGPSSPIYQQAIQDPSADNFKGYRDASFDKQVPIAGILERYKNINNPHGNSPVAATTDQFSSAFTLYPDQEELNRDNTLNETEEYFQYRVELKPNMLVGTNYITDKREVRVNLADNTTRTENWYLFRIPVKEYDAKTGNIPDFKSIRFIRMFLTNFEDSVVCRFGKLELVRNQWRKFQYETDSSGNYKPLPASDPTTLDILAVNLEENDRRQPIPYRQPPGIERQQQISNNNVQLLLNEQSLSLRACNLQPNTARGVFKTMNLDLRQYGKLSMFIHAESVNNAADLKDRELNAVVRIGNDFVSNYYEIKIPLNVTPFGAYDSLAIWPEANNLDFDLGLLTQLKLRRNSAPNPSPSAYYSETIGGKSYAILGNPNLGEVRGMLLAVQNARPTAACTEVWFNELRLSSLDEKGGWAALGRVDLRLADLGNVSFTGNLKSRGFGTLEQRVNERSREDFSQFDVSANLDLGKLVPPKAALQIPMYAGISQTTSTPEYDPYDLDVKLQDKLRNAAGNAKDSIRRDAIDLLTIKTLNFTNVKKNRTGDKKPQPWDISNIDVSYSYTRQERSNPIIENEELTRQRAALGYNYAPQQRFVEPLKNVVKSNSPWLSLIRDFNFNYKPSVLSFKADLFRQFGALRSRNVGGGAFKFPETYDKYFYFDRFYTLRWDLTRSITFDFNAVNNARVDEPFGRLDTKQKKDSVQGNLLKGGRNTRYHHDATLSYTLPTQKLPMLDWTSIRATYTAKYDWIAASLLAKNLGNTMMTGQTRNVNGEFNFDQLYNKWKLLRAVGADNAAKGAARQPKAPKDTAAKKQKDPNQLPQLSGVPKLALGLLTSLKRIGVQYTEDMGTLLPGYLDSTQFIGMNFRSHNPGWGYIFGYQPDTNGINSLGARGLLTRDSLFNALIQQRYNQKLNITAQVSPIRDLTIDLTLDRTYDKQYSELVKDTGSNSGLRRYNPYATGSFSISYISYHTLFTPFDPNVVSQTFRQFEANRSLLSQRLAKQNGYAVGNPQDAEGYVAGYGRYAQDVLIPAFISAYTNRDPTSVALVKNSNSNLRSNPFARLLPKPNWNITYNGLTRIKGVEKLFTNFTIRHGYTSNLSMNSFTTALLFQDPFHAGMPYFRDTLTGNYVPYFLVPNISIAEQFSPLVAVDMTFTNQLSTRFEYSKSRQLSLSLVDYQLAENRSTEYIFGFNWRKRGVPFLQNVRIGKKGTKLENDVTFRIDFSLRDDATANSKLDQNAAFGTAGQKVTRISPSIDYVLNKRINLKFYFEQNRMEPKIATSAPITTTRAGVQMRISLAP